MCVPTLKQSHCLQISHLRKSWKQQDLQMLCSISQTRLKRKVKVSVCCLKWWPVSLCSYYVEIWHNGTWSPEWMCLLSQNARSSYQRFVSWIKLVLDIWVCSQWLVFYWCVGGDIYWKRWGWRTERKIKTTTWGITQSINVMRFVSMCVYK